MYPNHQRRQMIWDSNTRKRAISKKAFRLPPKSTHSAPPPLSPPAADQLHIAGSGATANGAAIGISTTLIIAAHNEVAWHTPKTDCPPPPTPPE